MASNTSVHLSTWPRRNRPLNHLWPEPPGQKLWQRMAFLQISCASDPLFDPVDAPAAAMASRAKWRSTAPNYSDRF